MESFTDAPEVFPRRLRCFFLPFFSAYVLFFASVFVPMSVACLSFCYRCTRAHTHENINLFAQKCVYLSLFV